MSPTNKFVDYPYDIVDTDEELPGKVSRHPHELADKKNVMVGPKKYILPELYRKCHLEIYNLKARPDDVLLTGFPRSGTTLHSEMIWLIENQMDFDAAEKVIHTHRFPTLELCLTVDDPNVFNMLADDIKISKDIQDIAKGYTKLTLEHLDNYNGRRFLRSHLPLSLLSPTFFQNGCKVIYCARNPKDLVVSYYYLAQFFKPKEFELMSFQSFWNTFKNNLALYSPYFEHLKEAWEKRNDENFLFLFYEDTIKDLRLGIEKVANFLGKDLTKDQIEALVDHLNIDKFRKNKSVNFQHLCDIGMTNKKINFIREGGSGGWRQYFQGGLEVEVEQWIGDNLEGTDIVFPED